MTACPRTAPSRPYASPSTFKLLPASTTTSPPPPKHRYGLYFGILTRDAAEVASDRMAVGLGQRRRLAVSVRSCGICAGELEDALGPAAAPTAAAAGSGALGVAGAGRSTVQLSCKHLFHSDCIRGWTIVGKKDTCPTCHEKVDLRKLYASRPWESTNMSW